MKPKGCSKESLSFRNDFCIMTTYRSKPVVKPEDTHRFSRLRAYSLIASLCTLFYNTGRFRQNNKSWGSIPNLTNPDICKSSDVIINDTFFFHSKCFWKSVCIVVDKNCLINPTGYSKWTITPWTERHCNFYAYTEVK